MTRLKEFENDVLALETMSTHGAIAA